MGGLIALLPSLLNFLPVFISAWQHIRAQTGKTNDEILADAGATFDANSKKLIEDLIRLGVL